MCVCVCLELEPGISSSIKYWAELIGKVDVLLPWWIGPGISDKGSNIKHRVMNRKMQKDYRAQVCLKRGQPGEGGRS